MNWSDKRKTGEDVKQINEGDDLTYLSADISVRL